MLLEEMDNLMSKNPNADDRMKNREYTAEERRATFGHPKELIEKLHTACLSVKLTVENMPKLVERMEQKRKLHEMCAQVILDTTQLES